ncbi:MAG: Ferredoxin-type protein NapF (periplasmic nitrate reductase) [uncultured Sulfurovum sp.]|uniref:Ferredoxin-type protein NapF (Periplasmic nitrate reductase) n=1 Tax=uncultured Sulfurovum sp. TaxID=269237 RepID=A0A6S6TQC2_9BACT|nr:MAG: Ferredoxin-type protein NapF (periplasmic nitrate reductase) [uncultured Sulfurovum sp.]
MASRRDFLNTFRKPLAQNEENSPLLVRPPYGLNESLFQSECIECDSKACVASCDEKIIVIQEDGTPTLDFSKSGCTFCEECANACEFEVLSLENTYTSEHLNATFQISTQACVAHHGVICFSCKEPCIDDAILFNGMFNPVIDDEKCTACGFCLGRCPTEAISYTPKPIMEKTA